MHLIVAIQEELPDIKMTGSIGDFVRKLFSKQFTTPFVKPAWAKIRPREIRFFDFTIPTALEEEVLQFLAPFVGSKLYKLSKLMNTPILKGIIEKSLRLKAVDMDRYVKIDSDPQKKQQKDVGVRIAILGKFEDYWTDGVEQL